MSLFLRSVLSYLKRLLLVSVAFFVLLIGGCQGLKLVFVDNSKGECPSKGWVPDRCVTVGEFPYGDRVLYIPNKEPNRYRWIGGVTYDKQSKILRSPGLSFHWRTGEAGQSTGSGLPVFAEDLVTFQLSYFKDTANRPSFDDFPLTPSKAPPPFEVPHTYKAYYHARSEAVPENQRLYVFSDEERTTRIVCPSALTYAKNLDDLNARFPHVSPQRRAELESYASQCYGGFYARPGLWVQFNVAVVQLRQIVEIRAALSDLIDAWDTPKSLNQSLQRH